MAEQVPGISRKMGLRKVDHGEFCTLLEKSSNMSKNEEKPCSILPKKTFYSADIPPSPRIRFRESDFGNEISGIRFWVRPDPSLSPETTKQPKYSKYITTCIDPEDSDDDIVNIANIIWSNYLFNSINSDVFRHFYTLQQLQS